jgi:hypothetical protein
MKRAAKFFGFVMLVTSATFGQLLPTAAAAPSTKRVVTSCCEFRAPTAIRFSVSGDRASGSYQSFRAEVDSVSSSSSEVAVYDTLDGLGGGEETYQAASSQWAVSSGFVPGPTVYYIRAEFDRGCGEAGVLTITYPKSKQKQFGSWVGILSKSFRADLCG